MITQWKDKELRNEFRRMARAALGELGKPMVREAKRLVSKRTGKLKKSIKRRVIFSKSRPGEVALRVFSRSPVAHLIELGTKERVVKKTGVKVGRVTPQPFLRPVLDKFGPMILDKLGDEFQSTRAVKSRGLGFGGELG